MRPEIYVLDARTLVVATSHIKTLMRRREGDDVLASIGNELLDDRPMNALNQISVQTNLKSSELWSNHLKC